MSRKVVFSTLILAVAYLGVTLLLQPQLRTVLHVSPTPSTFQEPLKPSPSDNSTISYQCPGGKTALEALKEKATKVEVKSYSAGQMVESINGLKNGDGGKYWTYLIGDVSPNVGADLYRCRGTEMIEWRFGEQGK